MLGRIPIMLRSLQPGNNPPMHGRSSVFPTILSSNSKRSNSTQSTAGGARPEGRQVGSCCRLCENYSPEASCPLSANVSSKCVDHCKLPSVRMSANRFHLFTFSTYPLGTMVNQSANSGASLWSILNPSYFSFRVHELVRSSI